MPEADINEGGASRRRIIIRRSRGGGVGSGSSTHSESLRAPATEAESDEVDDAIDVDSGIAGIRSGALMPSAAPMPAADSGRENPRARLNQVALAGSANYAKEYRLVLLHRLLMRNVPLDQIATQLQVSISTVEKDRAELKKRLREQATQLNIEEMVGTQNAVYDEIAGMAMRVASQGAQRDENGNAIQAVPVAMRLAAMRTALAANADRTRFLNTAGVFDVLRFKRAEDGSNLSDVQTLMLRTLDLMQTLDEPETPTPRTGGFAPMTFDDADATGSSNEMESI